MTSTRSRFLLTAVALVAASTFLLFSPSSLAQSRLSARDQMALSQKKRIEAEADRLGMTPDQLLQFDTPKLGSPLLYDRNRKVTVACELNEDHSARTIHIASDPHGPETLSTVYRLGTDATPGTFTYTAAAPHDPAGTQAVVWQDLNADGIFDVLTIATRHNDLLNLDQGTYILIEGKWVAAVHETGASDRTMKVGSVTYAFDAATGRWAPQR